MGDYRAQLGCFRLLAGQDRLISNALLGNGGRHALLKALGPGNCIHALLSAERRYVIAPRSVVSRNGSLTLWKPIGGGGLSARTRIGISAALRHAFPDGAAQPSASLWSSLRATAKNGTPLLSLESGNFIEMLVYLPHSKMFHIPIVTHRGNFGT